MSEAAGCSFLGVLKGGLLPVLTSTLGCCMLKRPSLLLELN